MSDLACFSTDRQRHVTHVDASCRYLEPRLAAIGARLHEQRKGFALRAQRFEIHAFVSRHVRRDAHRADRNRLRWTFVEAHRSRPARHHRQAIDPLHDAPDKRDVPVQVARRLADHGIELGAVSGIRSIVLSDAHGAVTVHQPGLAKLPVASHGKAIGKAHLRRKRVRVGKSRERKPGIHSPNEFGLQRFGRHGFGALIAFGAGPLHHIIILDSDNEAAVKISFTYEGTNCRGVHRGVRSIELDDDPAAGKLHIQRVLGVYFPPFARSCGIQELRGRGRWRLRLWSLRLCEDQGRCACNHDRQQAGGAGPIDPTSVNC